MNRICAVDIREQYSKYGDMDCETYWKWVIPNPRGDSYEGMSLASVTVNRKLDVVKLAIL